eukprot:5815475-Pyramimonas_sp.AAC.1
MAIRTERPHGANPEDAVIAVWADGMRREVPQMTVKRWDAIHGVVKAPDGHDATGVKTIPSKTSNPNGIDLFDG